MGRYREGRLGLDQVTEALQAADPHPHPRPTPAPKQVMEKLQAADDVVELTFTRTTYADADDSWLDEVQAKAAAMPAPAPASAQSASAAAAAPQSSDPANQAADALKGDE